MEVRTKLEMGVEMEITVVLPDPKKPDKTVTGNGLSTPAFRAA